MRARSLTSVSSPPEGYPPGRRALGQARNMVSIRRDLRFHAYLTRDAPRSDSLSRKRRENFATCGNLDEPGDDLVLHSLADFDFVEVIEPASLEKPEAPTGRRFAPRPFAPKSFVISPCASMKSYSLDRLQHSVMHCNPSTCSSRA